MSLLQLLLNLIRSKHRSIRISNKSKIILHRIQMDNLHLRTLMIRKIMLTVKIMMMENFMMTFQIIKSFQSSHTKRLQVTNNTKAFNLSKTSKTMKLLNCSNRRSQFINNSNNRSKLIIRVMRDNSKTITLLSKRLKIILVLKVIKEVTKLRILIISNRLRKLKIFTVTKTTTSKTIMITITPMTIMTIITTTPMTIMTIITTTPMTIMITITTTPMTIMTITTIMITVNTAIRTIAILSRIDKKKKSLRNLRKILRLNENRKPIKIPKK